MFDSRPEVIAAQVEEAGGWDKYTGQLFYFSYRGTLYPEPLYHSVRKYMATEYLLGDYKYNSVEGGFVGNKIITVRGKYEDEDALDKLENDLNQIRGASGARRYLLFEGLNSDNEEKSFEITDLEPSVNDKLFKFTEYSIEDKITRALKGMDPILAGIHRQSSGLGGNSGERYETAQKIYNSRTEHERGKISAAFSRVFEHFPGIDSDFEIVPIQLQA